MSDKDTDTPRGPDRGDPSPTNRSNPTLLSERDNALMQSANRERSSVEPDNTLLSAQNMPSTTGAASADSTTRMTPDIPEPHEEISVPEQSTAVPEDHSLPSHGDLKYPASSSSFTAVNVIDERVLADPADDLNNTGDSEAATYKPSAPEAILNNDTPDVGQEIGTDPNHQEDSQDLAEGSSPQSSDAIPNNKAEDMEEGSSPETATSKLRLKSQSRSHSKTYVILKSSAYLPEEMDDDSASRLEWIRQKREEGAMNKVLDEVMCLVGREEVKEGFLSAKAVVEARRMRGEDLGADAINCTLAGTPGSGTFSPACY